MDESKGDPLLKKGLEGRGWNNKMPSYPQLNGVQLEKAQVQNFEYEHIMLWIWTGMPSTSCGNSGTALSRRFSAWNVTKQRFLPAIEKPSSAPLRFSIPRSVPYPRPDGLWNGPAPPSLAGFANSCEWPEI
ncbi:MAG: hypothetical protein KA118_03770 [Verrucomicrobia bacterium]|nr:hypothetical protein [Verrucomicrobiota bacterium]